MSLCHWPGRPGHHAAAPLGEAGLVASAISHFELLVVQAADTRLGSDDPDTLTTRPQPRPVAVRGTREGGSHRGIKLAAYVGED
jgi:hypothetical protein